MSEQKKPFESSANPTPTNDYDVTCDRCGKVGPRHVFIIEEGNEWECPECWERCNREEHARARQT